MWTMNDDNFDNVDNVDIVHHVDIVDIVDIVGNVSIVSIVDIGGQFGTGPNLALAPIWHMSQFGTGPIWHQESKRLLVRTTHG